MPRPRVLHLLSQRPSLTGSGVTLDALLRFAGVHWQQRAVVGVPAGEALPPFGGLDPGEVRPLAFGRPPLDFPVPGMSDVMPYRSTRFGAMDDEQLTAYRRAWREHLAAVVADFRPHVIHTHHIWLMSSTLADVAPGVPVVDHCHATGLRQLSLCPHLADEVVRGCRRNARFAVLHGGHATDLARALDVVPGRITVVGAGYRDDLFSPGGEPPAAKRLAYVGKYSAAKGVPQLLDAVERLVPQHPGLELHVAGGGAGEEADALRRRMDRLAPHVVQHGMLPQPQLADLLRQCSVAVLPSFYEGVPLVLVEALACGCRLVSSDLEGVRRELAPHLGEALQRVTLPRLAGVDVPVAEDLPVFVGGLTSALAEAVRRPPLEAEAIRAAVGPFGWGGVFERVEGIWNALIA